VKEHEEASAEGRPEGDPAAVPRAEEASGPLLAAVEAILFAAAEPVHPREIAAAVEGWDESEVEEALGTLRLSLERRRGGVRVERVAGGYRLATCPEVGAWVRQFFRQRNRTRLSSAALETLAIVAYRQPVTAPEIQAIRGVDPAHSLKSLLEKRLIRILGRKKVVGSPLLYGTTKQFLVHFGLDRLADLPSLDEFEQFLGSLDPAQTALFSPQPVGGAGDGVEPPADDARDEEE
jgi:segregation and condensation protein B